MRIIENQSFVSFDDRDSASTFSDVEFRKCYFESCKFSVTRDPLLRSKAQNLMFVNCSQRGCAVKAGIIEDVVVDGLRTNGQVFSVWGAVFNRVVLKGKIDRVMISSDVSPWALEPSEQAAFDMANDEFYSKVTWSLDISRGEFKDLCIRGIRSELIRRDTETQVIVTREKALDPSWRSLEFEENLWPVSLGLFLERGDASVVLVAPKRHPKFRRYLQDLVMLRKAGIAEAD